MPTEKQPRSEKKKGLSDSELIAKYEAGEQPVTEMLKTLLSKPADNAPVKRDKKS